jgi:predicted RNA-binding Zn-ribbon protein involved in translation (DUF1610 family)
MPERPGEKPRSFGRGLLLIVVTLGLYIFYWHYKAYKELEDAFPRRVDFPLGLYVLSYVPFISVVGQLLFMSSFISDVNELRYGHDLPRQLTLGGFLAWFVLGSFVIVGPFVAYYKLQSSINGVWNEAQRSSASPQQATTDPAERRGQDRSTPVESSRTPTDPLAPSEGDSGPAVGDPRVPEPAEPASPPDPAGADGEPSASSGPPETDSPGEPGIERSDSDPGRGDETDEVPADYEPHACSSCGEETAVPPERPLRLTCPACGNCQILRNGS